MLVDNAEAWRDMASDIVPGRFLYLDLETTGLDPHTEKMVMITLMQTGGEVYVIDARQPLARKQLYLLKSYFAQCPIVGHNLKFDLAWIYHNFDVWPGKSVWDTQLVQQVIQGRGLSSGKAEGISFNLGKLASQYAGVEMNKDTRNYFIGLDKRGLGEAWIDGDWTTCDNPEYIAWYGAFPEDVVTYAELDVTVLPKIFTQQRQHIMDNPPPPNKPGMGDCVNLENRAVLAMASMEHAGVPLDWEAWRAIIGEKEIEAQKLRNDALALILPVIIDSRSVAFDEQLAVYIEWEKEMLLFKETLEKGNIKEPLAVWKKQHPRPDKPKLDTGFNLSSPPQLMELFGILGVPVRSTGKEVLQQVEDRYPVVKAVLAWRDANKFVTSFGESVLERANDATHRLHSDYIQIGADSDRVSCTRPNWQNQPSRSVTGKRLRACVCVGEDRRLLTGDFSSQELVILTELSGEQGLANAFRDGISPHVSTARLMFNLDESVNPKESYSGGDGVSDYDKAKQINYGIAYGMTKYRLSRLLRNSLEEAQALIDLWYRAYPSATSWLNRRKDQANRGEWHSTTLHGWRRTYRPLSTEPVKPFYGKGDYHAWKEKHREWERERGHLENMMMNTPIQGTAAGMAKLALTLFFERAILKSERPISSRPLIVAFVHDEIVVECEADDAKTMAALLSTCMDDAEETFIKQVQFPRAEVHIGQTWSH